MPLNSTHPDREKIWLKEGKVALCRCWQSSKFPYCDGSHRAFNEEHNDCVGPIIVRCTEED